MNSEACDARYCGGAYWQSPTFRKVRLIYVGNSQWVLDGDPMEHGGMACSYQRKDGTYTLILTEAEVKAHLDGWTYLGDFADCVNKAMDKVFNESKRLGQMQAELDAVKHREERV